MANPVLDSVTPAGPITAQVGTVVSVKAVAHDADARVETWNIKPVDSTGNAGTPTSLQITWTDPVRFEVTGPPGSPTVVNVQADGTITFVG